MRLYEGLDHKRGGVCDWMVSSVWLRALHLHWHVEPRLDHTNLLSPLLLRLVPTSPPLLAWPKPEALNLAWLAAVARAAASSDSRSGI